jgi:hypothetical protein
MAALLLALARSGNRESQRFMAGVLFCQFFTLNPGKIKKYTGVTMPRNNKPIAKKDDCKCRPGMLIVAWILAAVGLWALVGGFATQFTSFEPTAANAGVLAWYLLGILLIFIAKKMKCMNCMCHKK